MKDMETDQARTLAVAAPGPDMPVRVDVAMTRRAAEYTGPCTEPGSREWWRKVRIMARRIR